MSDWYATHDTVRGALAGLDLEMPGPARTSGPRWPQAVRDGAVPAEAVAEKARRVLRLADRVGADGRSGACGAVGRRSRPLEPGPRRAAAARWCCCRTVPSTVAPCCRSTPAALRQVAVIGPNADVAMIQGGGSAQGHTASHRHAAGRAAGPPGCRTSGRRSSLARDGALLPVLDGRLASVDERPGHPHGLPGRADGPELFTTVVPRLDPIWFGRFSPGRRSWPVPCDRERHHPAERDGHPHVRAHRGRDPPRVTLDGCAVLDTDGQASGAAASSASARRSSPRHRPGRRASRTTWSSSTRARRTGSPGCGSASAPPSATTHSSRAAAAAAAADVAVVVVGTDEEWETEGRDRSTMSLPGAAGRAGPGRGRGQPAHGRRGERRRRGRPALGRRRGRHPR